MVGGGGVGGGDLFLGLFVLVSCLVWMMIDFAFVAVAEVWIGSTCAVKLLRMADQNSRDVRLAAAAADGRL